MKLTYKKDLKCALMYCEIPDDTPVLLDMARSSNEMIAYQAKRLMEKHGFSPTARFCIDCFWK